MVNNKKPFRNKYLSTEPEDIKLRNNIEKGIAIGLLGAFLLFCIGLTIFICTNIKFN